MFRINKKLGIIIALTLIGGGFTGYRLLNKNGESAYVTAKVVKGEIREEVLATGQVKRGEEIGLGFKTGGTIIDIYVGLGQMVESNQALAKIDTVQLEIQAQEARANLNYARAELDKLLAGATSEEIAVKQALVKSAQTNFANAQENLIDVKAIAEENLKAAYEDALNVLDDADLKINNSFNVVDLIQRYYFTYHDQESSKVKEEKSNIQTATLKTASFLAVAKASSKNQDIDMALSEMKSALKIIFNALSVIRDSCESSSYRSAVSAADKASLDGEKAYINGALADIIGSQQDISSTNLSNQSNINTAEGGVSSAKDDLDKAEKDFALISAKPRNEDLVLYQARVGQAEANVNLLLNQINQAKIFAPVSGQIIRIEKEIGETVQASSISPVISLIPVQPFEVEIDIAETDIGKVDVGNECKIVLDAFPEKTLSGRVVEIDPAETIIQGVVYYQVRVSFEDGIGEERIKPGMTAEVIILTAFSQDALIIPQRAVAEKNGFKTVRVIMGEQIQAIEVKTGIRSSEGTIEIISGLQEGDEMITFENEK